MSTYRPSVPPPPLIQEHSSSATRADSTGRAHDPDILPPVPVPPPPPSTSLTEVVEESPYPLLSPPTRIPGEQIEQEEQEEEEEAGPSSRKTGGSSSMLTFEKRPVLPRSSLSGFSRLTGGLRGQREDAKTMGGFGTMVSSFSSYSELSSPEINNGPVLELVSRALFLTFKAHTVLACLSVLLGSSSSISQLAFPTPSRHL